jgi:hypothetical protein
MSFVRFNPEDFVVSTDSVTTTLWSNFTPTLTTFFTSSTGVGGTTTGSAGYINVYQSNPAVTASAEIQFSLAYGRVDSSGSAPYNLLVPQNTPTRVTYGQYRTLVNGDENTNFNFGQNNTSSVDLYVINIERARYKDHLFLGTFNLNLSVLGGGGNLPTPFTGSIILTNNSNNVSTVTYCDAGRVYDIVSGTNGTAITTAPFPGVVAGYTPSGSYGWYLPDVGLILLNPRALALQFVSGGINLQPYSASVTSSYNGDLTGPSGSLARLFQSISGSLNSGSFQINSEENISSDYVFVRVKNTEFNYSTNPSIISGSGEFVYPSLVSNPQTFPTTVGMYNDNNELLAVAKLSKALPKDFTKEALIRVKLDF